MSDLRERSLTGKGTLPGFGVLLLLRRDVLSLLGANAAYDVDAN